MAISISGFLLATALSAVQILECELLLLLDVLVWEVGRLG